MAFGGTPMAGATHLGPDLLEITQEVVGFQPLAGDARVRLSTPWPDDQLPAPTSSLLAIAQKAGLLAAAGPDGIYLARTETVRKRFTAGVTPDSNNIDLPPELKLPMSQRMSQICFTSDEKYLVISAEQGGGLAFYEVANLLQGNTQSAFELGTNGVSIRMLLPNPTQGELLAMITMNGDLMLAELNQRQFQPLRSGITSASWSAKGKQIAAGSSEGVLVQLTPQGQVKAEIPKPQGLGVPGQHVASMMWLENDVFLVIYTGSKSTPEEIPVSEYTLITRKDGAFTYQKLPEVCSPFGKNRAPQFQFLQRLRDFPPNLQDVIVVSSTCAEDIELFTRSKIPLTSAGNAAQITNVFTATKTMDNRRAQLPMGEDGLDSTTPLGVVLDLSSTTPVERPLPGEEMDRSPGPLPAVIALNNQGLLSAWWIIYADSIRQGTTYPGMVAASPNPQQQPQTQAPANPFATNASQSSVFGAQSQAPANPFATGGAAKSTFGQPAFGQSAFGQSSFGNQQSTSAFGTSTASPFGASLQPAASSAFGSAAQPGAQSSPWGSSANKPASTFGQSAFGQPAFGQPAAPAAAPAFGSNTGLGSQSSPWGSKSTATTSAFGQVGMPSVRSNPFASPSATSAFGGAASGNTSSSGFSAFANRSGFAAASGSSGQSVFGQASNAAPPPGSTTSSFGQPSKPTFGTLDPTPAPQQPAFGSASGPAFGGGSSSSWLSRPADNASSNAGFFGSSFGSALQTPAAPSTDAADADMDDGPGEQLAPPRDASMSPDPEDRRNKFVPFAAPLPEPSKSVEVKQTFEPQAPLPSSPDKPSTSTAETAAPPSAPLPPVEAKPAEKINIFANNTPAEKKPEPAAPKPENSNKPTESASKPLFNPFANSAANLPLPPDTTSKTTYTPTNSTTSSKPPSDRTTSDASAAPETKTAEMPSFTPVKAQKTPSIFDTPLSNDEKTNSNPFAHLTANKEEVVEDDEEDEEEEEADEEGEDEEEDGQHDEDDDIPSESPSWASEDEEDATNEEGSGVDVADELTPPEQSPQAVSKGLFSSSPMGGSSTFAAAMNAANKKHAPKPAAPTSRGVQKARRSSTASKNQRPSIFGVHGSSPPAKASSVLRASSPPNVVRPLHSSFVQTPAKPVEPSHVAKSKPSSTNPVRTGRRISQPIQEEPLEDDHEEVRMRKELFTEPDATTTLAPLLTHQDYVGSTHKTGIPAQIEILYKDVNSMIDTVGYNARSLKAFVKGHSELYKESGRDRADLTSNKPWCLSEVEDLSTIQRGLLDDIEEVRRADLGSDIKICSSLTIQLAKLKNKLQEVQHSLSVHTNQDLRKHLSKGPLPSAQSTQQQQIRALYLDFQARIAQLEEEITNLRVKIAAHGATSKNGDKPRVPTVEAVERTIAKMTNMVQEKTSNIDILELQLRKLDLTGSPVRFTSPLRNSLGASRGSVSQSVRRSIFAPRTSLGGPEISFSPRTSRLSTQGNLQRSVQGRKVADITGVQVAPLAEQFKQRDAKVRVLEKVLTNRKVVVRKVGHETR